MATPGGHAARTTHLPSQHAQAVASRTCGSVTAGVHCGPHGVAPITNHTASRDNPVVALVRKNDTITHQALVTRGPHSGHLFASLRRPRDTGCSLEAIDMTGHRGIVRGTYSRSMMRQRYAAIRPSARSQEHHADINDTGGPRSTRRAAPLFPLPCPPRAPRPGLRE